MNKKNDNLKEIDIKEIKIQNRQIEENNNHSPIYFFGSEKFNFLSSEQKQIKTTASKGKIVLGTLTNFETIISITTYFDEQSQRILIQTSSTDFVCFYINPNSKKCFNYHFKAEKIHKIRSNLSNAMILTNKGNIYSLGTSHLFSELPFTDPENCQETIPRKVTFFEEKKLFIKDIVLGGITNYYLCSDNKLYGSGQNQYGQLGKDAPTDHILPIELFQNIERIFSNKFSRSLYFAKTTSNKIYVCGKNNWKFYKILKKSKEIPYIEVPNVYKKSVKKIIDSTYHSLLLTNNGQLYSSGKRVYNGFKISTIAYKKITYFRNIIIQQVETGPECTLVLSNQNKFYYWGNFFKVSQLNSRELKQVDQIPQILIPDIKPFYSSINIFCGVDSNFIYQSKCENPLIIDFEHLFKMQLITDVEFKNTSIKSHKLFLELRLKKNIEQIVNVLNNYSEKKILIFLNWIYTGSIQNLSLIESIYQKIQKDFKNVKSFKQDIALLYNDNETKDFSIIIKNCKVVNSKGKRKGGKEKKREEEEEENENENDDEDEKEEEKEEEKENSNKNENLMIKKDSSKVSENDEKDTKNLEKKENVDEFDDVKIIKIHKLILVARSGLFRALFEFKDQINEINDYSGKSFECLNIFFNFLYTQKLEIPNNKKKFQIISELEDIADYFQLNEYSLLTHQLEQIKCNLKLIKLNKNLKIKTAPIHKYMI
ncbi:regulator of chromosome condensation [Anaeramoeba flamelloides]|uniref:Regulator of chromosome condensation n=1 Tax=Anaeramoeba flamelloides TaxID=1746091 RepID=A0AAV7ZH25_9EUKA|nr:regulator of chromosome condensation [Anaeramoeba flamelloides]